MDDRDIQKVKITGLLWTTRNIIAILRDIAIIILVLVLIGVALSLSSSVSGILQDVGGAGGVGSLLGMMQQGEGGGGMEELVGRLQQDINKGDWNSAQDKVNQLEFIIKQSGDTQTMNDLQQMKQAILEKNAAKANTILSKSGSKNRG